MTQGRALPELIELHRDQMWRRDPENRVEDARSAEQFVEDVGFAAAMTDNRRDGPSLYVAVCGRRDAHMPRNVQKDPESSLTWTIKDELMQRGNLYYAKLRQGQSRFITRRLVPHFNCLWGVARKQESVKLSEDARRILRVLRREWEMATGDLRKASGVADRAKFQRAIDELQKHFKVVPSQAVYQPVFTYIWTLAETRFQKELETKTTRDTALMEIARAYLRGAGMTLRGELARATGLGVPEAGLGNWALVDEGFAVRKAPGVYLLKEFDGA